MIISGSPFDGIKSKTSIWHYPFDQKAIVKTDEGSLLRVLALRASFMGIDVPSVVLSLLTAVEFQRAEGFHVSLIELKKGKTALS
jgi:hypothetical protein